MSKFSVLVAVSFICTIKLPKYSIASQHEGTVVEDSSHLHIQDVLVQESPREVFLVLNLSYGDYHSKVLQTLLVPYYVIYGTIDIRRYFKPISFPDNFVFVILTETLANVKPLIYQSLHSRLIVNRTRILVSLRDKSVTCRTLEELFKDLWLDHILNVNVLVRIRGNERLITYNPYSSEYCMDILREHRVGRTFFEEKTRNFYGNKLHLYMLEVVPDFMKIYWINKWIWNGENAEMIKPLAKYYNATLQITQIKDQDFGFEVFSNDSYSIISSGLALSILNNMANLTLKRRSVNTSYHLDYIYPLETNNFPGLIPKAQAIPQYLAVYLTLGPSVKLSLLIILIITSVTLKAIAFKEESPIHSVLILFKLTFVLLGQPLPFPLKSNASKFVVVSWHLFSVCMVVIFTGDIVTNLVTSKYYADIDTIETALKLFNYSFYAHFELAAALKGWNPGTVELRHVIQNRLKGLPRDEFYRVALNPTGQESFIGFEENQDWIIEQTRFSFGKRPAYHKTKPSFNSNGACYLPRGSPIFQTFDSFNKLSFEAGLKNFWRRKSAWYNGPRDLHVNGAATLGLQHIGIGFIFLIGGYVISAFAFILEVVYKHTKKDKNLTKKKKHYSNINNKKRRQRTLFK